jgi:hypothetical protein
MFSMLRMMSAMVRTMMTAMVTVMPIIDAPKGIVCEKSPTILLRPMSSR